MSEEVRDQEKEKEKVLDGASSEKAENIFSELASVDVRSFTEKKNGFSYLSWAHAVQQLKQRHPDSQIITKRFPEVDNEGRVREVPYLKTNLGYFVEVEVIVNGVSVTEVFPITDYRNKPIPNPTTFDVNTSIQRAKVKAIAGHGLGLYIYAGEDLPIDSDDTHNGSNLTRHQDALPPNQPPAQSLATEAEKQELKNSVAELAMLNLGQGASQDDVSLKMQEIFTHYQITANLTSAYASQVIASLKTDIASFHKNRMQQQEVNQEDKASTNAPIENLDDVI